MDWWMPGGARTPAGAGSCGGSIRGQMELGEVHFLRMPAKTSAVRILFALCLGAWMTATMWVVTRSPWAGVFALGAALGWVLLDYWLLLEEDHERRDEVMELEKQVVSLRASMSSMAHTHVPWSKGGESGKARAAFRAKRHASSEPVFMRALS